MPAKVRARTYLSPTLVLLAYDWSDGETRSDFLGFQIEREPGFDGKPSSFLPNRLTFSGPAADGKDVGSDQAPIQKLFWWDARIDSGDTGRVYRYTIAPVCGTPGALNAIGEAATTIEVTIPEHVVNGIGSWFNRAVLSSQAFSRQLQKLGIAPGQPPPLDKSLRLRKWLGNGLEQAIPAFLSEGGDVAGAIYHLTDTLWVIPALQAYAAQHQCRAVYDEGSTIRQQMKKSGAANPNAAAVAALSPQVVFTKRTKTKIMHDKILVSGQGIFSPSPSPARVLCGSANFTTEGLTSQANLLHTFQSAALAEVYLARYQRLAGNPTLAKTAAGAAWSDPITVGGAGVRVFFSPEPKGQRASLNRVVEAIHRARSSVVFCLFMPTDADLRSACFAVGDNGKLMFGLVNVISEGAGDLDPAAEDLHADQIAQIELYHRKRDQRDVVDARFFRPATTPVGFTPEINVFPGEHAPAYPPVIIHHKFIVIDAESTNPTIYTGSANMSAAAQYGNDENLMEIVGNRPLAETYLAEFLRLYEHYRARAQFIARKVAGTLDTFSLVPDRSWANKYYRADSPESRARRSLVSDG